MHKALLLLLQQMYALQQVAEGQKESQGGPDFNEMMRTENSVIKIQSRFRGELERKKMAKDFEIKKRRLEQVAAKKSQSNEEAVLLEFKQRLQKKGGLTPEAFFRVCD